MDKDETTILTGVLFFIIAFCLSIVGILHGCALGFHWGLPDDTHLLNIEFTKNSNTYNVFGKSYNYVKDEYGNNKIIVIECYESGWFSWNLSAKQKSFYGDLIKVTYVDDPDFIPVK